MSSNRKEIQFENQQQDQLRHKDRAKDYVLGFRLKLVEFVVVRLHEERRRRGHRVDDEQPLQDINRACAEQSRDHERSERIAVDAQHFCVADAFVPVEFHEHFQDEWQQKANAVDDKRRPVNVVVIIFKFVHVEVQSQIS